MAQSERFAIAEEQRIANVNRVPMRNAADALSRAPSPVGRAPTPVDRAPAPVHRPPPVNDVGSGARGRVAFDDIDDRVQQAFEHKLIGPLSSIVEMGVMLEQQLDGSQAERVRAMTRAARRQSHMLRNVLSFVQTSKADRIHVRRRRVDLRRLCERFFDAFQGLHPDYAIALVASKHVEGEWDPDLIERLLSHLADNAVEHGDASKAVRVLVRPLDDDAIVEITSSAPALDKDVLTHLFAPFNCGPSEHSDESERLGLGLFLANQIARAHSGRIDAWSDLEKATTTFRVTLPRA